MSFRGVDLNHLRFKSSGPPWVGLCLWFAINANDRFEARSSHLFDACRQALLKAIEILGEWKISSQISVITAQIAAVLFNLA